MYKGQTTYDAACVPGIGHSDLAPDYQPALARLGDRLSRLIQVTGEASATLGILQDRLFGCQPEPSRVSEGAKASKPAGQLDTLNDLLDELEWRAAQTIDRAHGLNSRI